MTNIVAIIVAFFALSFLLEATVNGFIIICGLLLFIHYMDPSFLHACMADAVATLSKWTGR